MKHSVPFGLKLALFGCLLALPGQSTAGELDDPSRPLGFITRPKQGDPLRIALDFVRGNPAGLDLEAADVADFVVTDHYRTKHNGATHVYLRQIVDGIEVANANLNINISRDGRVLNVGNSFVKGLQAAVTSRAAVLSPVQAVTRGAETLGLKISQPLEIKKAPAGLRQETLLSQGGVSLEDIPAKLQYFALSRGEVRLAWDIVIYASDHQHTWQIKVDAVSGKLLDKGDWTANETYEVIAFPKLGLDEGPRTFVANPFDPMASPFGWHDDNGAAGAEYPDTRGNNVSAQEDTDADNVFIGTRPVKDPNGVFTFPFDTNDPPIDYLPAATVNLFYWNNILHDIVWQYGFDEPAGNFQTNNYGRGGFGLDQVQADSQDGSGSNNANFTTPPDGLQPRMQMFRWLYPFSNRLQVNSPGNIAGSYVATNAGFGPALAAPMTRDLVLGLDPNNPSGPSQTDGCSALTNAAAITGKIAIFDRGSCNFTVKVKSAQNAGATAAVIINNIVNPPFSMAGTDGTITIPSAMISLADGNTIRPALGTGVNVTFRPSGQDALPDRDSDFDNGVIAHEYGHGISNRLTGGPSNVLCLQNQQSAGMGEGWSDFWTLALTAKASQAPSTARGVGTYLTYEATTGFGIRTFPYSTDMAVNPQTFGAVRNVAANSPHPVGAIWSQMLWEVYWNLVQQHGFDDDLYRGTGGNNLMIQLVIDGMKLQECNPTFVQARNAILLADVLDNGGANQCAIWRGFAKRGLGSNAVAGTGSNDLLVTEGFALPSECGGPTPTATGITTSTPTSPVSASSTPASTATATRTPSGPTAAFTQDSIVVGAPAQASGSLPSGDYTLCVVPNRTFQVGQSFPNGAAVTSCKAVTVTGGTLPATTVWDSATAGSYDLLVLTGPGNSGTIVAGDDAGSAAGLTVGDVLGNNLRMPLALALLLSLGTLRLIRRPHES